MTLNILGVSESLIPSYTVQVKEPLLKLSTVGNNNINFDECIVRSYKKSQLNGIDCVIFCRVSSPKSFLILKEVIKRSIPYVYDIDDNFFRVPVGLAIGRHLRAPFRLSLVLLFLKRANLVRVNSQQLLKDVKVINTKVVQYKCYFDLSLINAIPQIKIKKNRKNSVVKIIYATSRKEDALLRLILPALKVIADKYKGLVGIYIWGSDPSVLQDLLKRENVFHLSIEHSYASFISKFNAYDFDIGLAPVQFGPFFDSKDNTKYREYGGMLVAGIYSNTGLYNDSVQHRETGLLVSNTERGWVSAIEELVNNQSLREKIQVNARYDVEHNYNMDSFCQILKQNINMAVSDNERMKNLKIHFVIDDIKSLNLSVSTELNISTYYNFFTDNLYITLTYLFYSEGLMNDYFRKKVVNQAKLEFHIPDSLNVNSTGDIGQRIVQTANSVEKYLVYKKKSLFKKNYMVIVKNHLLWTRNYILWTKNHIINYKNKEFHYLPVSKIEAIDVLTNVLKSSRLNNNGGLAFLFCSNKIKVKAAENQLQAYLKHNNDAMFIVFHEDESFKVSRFREELWFVYLPPGSVKVL